MATASPHRGLVESYDGGRQPRGEHEDAARHRIQENCCQRPRGDQCEKPAIAATRPHDHDGERQQAGIDDRQGQYEKANGSAQLQAIFEEVGRAPQSSANGRDERDAEHEAPADKLSEHR